MSAQTDLSAILEAWNTWRIQSNAAKSDNGCRIAFEDFSEVLEPIAVANGKPPGVPTRKLG